jgi:hypothetical protein
VGLQHVEWATAEGVVPANRDYAVAMYSTVEQIGASGPPRDLSPPTEMWGRGFRRGVVTTLLVLAALFVGWKIVHEFDSSAYKQGQDYRNSILLHEDPNYGSVDTIPQSVIGELCWRKLYSMWGDPVDDDWMVGHPEVHPFMAGCANMSLKRASRVW